MSIAEIFGAYSAGKGLGNWLVKFEIFKVYSVEKDLGNRTLKFEIFNAFSARNGLYNCALKGLHIIEQNNVLFSNKTQ